MENFQSLQRPTTQSIVCSDFLRRLIHVAALGDEAVARIVKTIAVYDDFCHDNDPWDDFGAFEVDGHKIFFKIDYYDPTLTDHSDDPADPTITHRLITIMLAEEY